MDYYRKIFFVFGVLFLCLIAFILFASMMAGSAPPSGSYILLSMAVMSFCLSYLYPQFKQKDERMRMIRQKGMFATFIALFAYCILLNFGLQTGILQVSAADLIQILTAMIISTVFISFVVYSKIY
ncbi:permease [Bacillus salacetis]|uniref:Permease n=1 Tax=Bacillus salacetis TaxID=2315464 RepID=A0A3A1QXD8_9BACI|nr:permease [Bacillus salacetis]RIW33099.1 permease [Bacillus salacetis]